MWGMGQSESFFRTYVGSGQLRTVPTDEVQRSKKGYLPVFLG
jgi:hypothetical protein